MPAVSGNSSQSTKSITVVAAKKANGAGWETFLAAA
jgi:hypothetical protein